MLVLVLVLVLQRVHMYVTAVNQVARVGTSARTFVLGAFTGEFFTSNVRGAALLRAASRDPV